MEDSVIVLATTEVIWKRCQLFKLLRQYPTRSQNPLSNTAQKNMGCFLWQRRVSEWQYGKKSQPSWKSNTFSTTKIVQHWCPECMFSNSQCPLESDRAMIDPIWCQCLNSSIRLDWPDYVVSGVSSTNILQNQLKRSRPQSWSYLWKEKLHFTARDSSICYASVNSFGNKSWSKN